MLAGSAQKNTGPTAGPWRVEDVAVNGSLAIMAGSATEYRWLATVSEDLEAGIDWTQTQANARLIANAPRLLKTAKDLWHANAAEGSDRDELLIASAWAELIDAIKAAEPQQESHGQHWDFVDEDGCLHCNCGRGVVAP